MATTIPSRRWPRNGLGFVAAFVLFAFFVLDLGIRLGVEAFWFSELGYLPTLQTRLTTQIVLAITGFLVAMATLSVTLLAVLRRSPVLRVQGSRDVQLALVGLEQNMPRFVLLAAGLAALGFASACAQAWLPVQVFLHRIPYGLSDPIFGHDVGFYLFTLPILRGVVTWMLSLAVLALVGTGAFYFLRGALVGPRGVNPVALRHLAWLGAGVLLLVAARYWVVQYDVLFSTHGALVGAGFTDVNAYLPGVRVLVVTSLVALGLVLYGALRGRLLWVGVGPAVLLLVHSLATIALPAVLQKLVVEPNELVKERPFIEHALRLTREAYDLNGIEEQPFEVSRELDTQTLRQHRSLVENIRLWDWRPLLATYGQIQEIRLYYNFGDVDIDRYTLNGSYRQIMLSARELAHDQIPQGARTWVNSHLKYTHGYGLCMSPVNRVTKEGLPELLIRDIPPVSKVDIQITRPEIYYGEQTETFSLVGASTDEFDYPVGETNQLTRYQGKGGIGIGSLPRRLLFSWHLRSRELLLTGYLTPESRILLRRSLHERIPRLAPFLRYDRDPYMVIHEGRLVWIQDAYTVSNRFPYSRLSGSINYIRNAVKVVVDAYDGTAHFYVNDPDDPLLRVYRSIFPQMFRPLEEMPRSLRDHLRYPVDLFQIQADVFATYHMRDPEVFYNREDLWDIPVETQAGREILVQPYYAMIRLPGDEREELVLLLPFTPSRKDNMIAWMAARCDGDQIGERLVFLFPKQELVYGPRQIEARIDQDATISQQLTLWSQRGSSVLRGNLLVIPIANTLLYVEPLYLEAEKGALPELKRVIVAHADQIHMAEDLDTALALLVGASVRTAPRETSDTDDTSQPTAALPGTTSPTERALDLLRAARLALEKGDWAEHGRAMQRLQHYLETESDPATPPTAP